MYLIFLMVYNIISLHENCSYNYSTYQKSKILKKVSQYSAKRTLIEYTNDYYQRDQ